MRRSSSVLSSNIPRQRALDVDEARRAASSKISLPPPSAGKELALPGAAYRIRLRVPATVGAGKEGCELRFGYILLLVRSLHAHMLGGRPIGRRSDAERLVSVCA